MDKICGMDILVLDDMGAEKTSGWVNDRLYAIINHRYERKKTTIITSNHSNIELQEQVGNRIYSRLNEMCDWKLFDGEDYRIQMMRSGKG
jgi:DNA replication protein DnaC